MKRIATGLTAGLTAALTAALTVAILAGGRALPAMAQEITTETFADRVVEWEFGEQDFLASGRTRDRLLTDSWGWWELRDDRLCLLWPPAEDWDCARITLADGALRLEFDDGRIQTGRFRK